MSATCAVSGGASPRRRHGRSERIQASGERGELTGLALELDRPGSRGLLPALDRGAAELYRAELARPRRDPVLRDGELRFTSVELCGSVVQLCLTGVELRGSLPENLLDAGVELARPLLAALEIVDGRQELLGAQLELPTVHGDEVGDGVTGVGGGEQAAEAAAHARVAQLVRVIPFALALCLILHEPCLQLVIAPTAHPKPSSSNEPPAPYGLRHARCPLLP